MVEEITQIITNVCFPIACCVVHFINNKKITESLNKLNVTLTEITNRLENIEGKINDNWYNMESYYYSFPFHDTLLLERKTTMIKIKYRVDLIYPLKGGYYGVV